jgi:hypothetical protein
MCCRSYFTCKIDTAEGVIFQSINAHRKVEAIAVVDGLIKKHNLVPLSVKIKKVNKKVVEGYYDDNGVFVMPEFKTTPYVAGTGKFIFH